MSGAIFFQKGKRSMKFGIQIASKWRIVLQHFRKKLLPSMVCFALFLSVSYALLTLLKITNVVVVVVRIYFD